MLNIMARTSSMYDHFDLYLTSVTLTFNLPENMFQMALLLFEGNYAKLFSNPCINVQVMARTISIHVYDHFDFYFTPVTLTLNLPEKFFKWHLCFQCRGVLLIWSRGGQGPTALPVGCGWGLSGHFLSSIISLFFLPLSERRPDID